MAEFQQLLWAHVRLAKPRDAPHVLSLIQQLAEFERLTEMCVATVPKLESTLFLNPTQPFSGPSVLLLEVSNNPPDEIPQSDPEKIPEDDANLENPEKKLGNSENAENPVKHSELPDENLEVSESLEKNGGESDEYLDKENPGIFSEITREFELRSPIKDNQALSFRSSEDRIIAGLVLFFPNYSTFLAKPGFYIEDLYVRECYRGRGFGSLLLKTVAKLAVKLDYGRVEWCVLDWNMNAIKFYEGIGAKVLPEWRICRLTGEALNTCASQTLKHI